MEASFIPLTGKVKNRNVLSPQICGAAHTSRVKFLILEHAIK